VVALLQHRKVTKTVKIELPDGSERRVKVTTEDHRFVQHVEDWTGRIHGTGCPVPARMMAITPNMLATRRSRRAVLRGMKMPKGTQAFARQGENTPWVPVPGSLEELVVARS